MSVSWINALKKINKNVKLINGLSFLILICLLYYFIVPKMNTHSLKNGNEFMGFGNCSMFFCTLPYVPSSFAIILTGKIELAALLLFVILVSRDCCVALPRCAMGLFVCSL